MLLTQVYESGSRIWRSKGDAQKAAKKDFIDCLKLLEVELGEKPYFGGYSLGFVDVALIPFACSWFYTYETFGNFNVEGDMLSADGMGKEVHGEGEHL